jgi:hypothetical protein
MVRFVPGLIGAISAFWVPKLTSWLGSLWLELLVYLGVYGVITVLLDQGMKRYGEKG